MYEVKVTTGVNGSHVCTEFQIVRGGRTLGTVVLSAHYGDLADLECFTHVTVSLLDERGNLVNPSYFSFVNPVVDSHHWGTGLVALNIPLEEALAFVSELAFHLHERDRRDLKPLYSPLPYLPPRGHPLKIEPQKNS